MLLINLFQIGFGLQLTATALSIGDGMDYKTLRNNLVMLLCGAAFCVFTCSKGIPVIGIPVLILCALCLLSIII